VTQTPAEAKRNWRLSAFEVERRQIADLRTLIEIAQGEHNARLLARLVDRNFGGRGVTRVLLDWRRPDETVSELNAFRKWLLGGVQKMFQEDGWTLTLGDPVLAAYSIAIRARGQNQYEDKTGAAAPRLAAWRLLELHKWRVERCAWEKCERLGRFFVTHKKSAYCSARHAQNARTARYRERLAKSAVIATAKRKHPRKQFKRLKNRKGKQS
jgi:hypothetical protein